MPLDPNIALAAVQRPRNSLTEDYMNALNLRQMQQQMAMQEAAVARDTARRNALTGAWGDGGLDYGKAEQALVGVGDVEGAIGIRGQRLAEEKGKRAERKEQLSAGLAEIDAEARLLGGVKDAAGYEAARQRAMSIGIDASDWPAQYDPALVQQAIEASYDAKMRMEIERNAEKMKFEREKFGYQKKQDQEQNSIARERNDISRSRASGLVMYTDENGNQVFAMGGGMGQLPNGNMAPDKTVARETQKDVINAVGTLDRLDEIANNYKRDYLTTQGRVSGWVGTQADRLGMASKDQKQFIQGRRRFTQMVDQEFNAYRKDITGAAAAMAELESLKKAMINTDLSPSEFEAAYTTYRESVGRMLRLKQRILREGIPLGSKQFQKVMDDAWTSGADDSADARGMELESQGMPEQQVLQQLRREGYTR